MNTKDNSITGLVELREPRVALTRKHYTRLREYWHAGNVGLSSSGDGLALDLAADGLLQLGRGGASAAVYHAEGY